MAKERISDFELILNRLNIGIGFNYKQETGVKELNLVITGTEGMRNYEPRQFLDIILDGYYTKIESCSSILERYNMAIEAKNYLIHHIEFIKEHTAYKLDVPIRQYDYSFITNKINSYCETLEKLCNNVKLKREIYWYKDPRFWSGFLVASIGAISAVLLKHFIK